MLWLSDLDHWVWSLHRGLTIFAEIVVWPDRALVPDADDGASLASIAGVAVVHSLGLLSLALAHANAQLALRHLALDVCFDLVSDHRLDLLEELHVDLALAHAFSAGLSFLVDLLAIAFVANGQVLAIGSSLWREKSAAHLLLLADGVLLAALRISLDLGVAAALRDPGLVALGACLAGPDDGSNAGVSHPDSLRVAAKAILGSLSAIQLIDHVFGIGASGRRLLLLVSDIAAAGNGGLLAHLDVGLGGHGLDVGAGLYLSVGLLLDPVAVLLDHITGSFGQSRLVGEWLDVKVVEERGAAVGSVAHGPHLVLQILQLDLLSHQLDLLLKLELVVAHSGQRLSTEGVGLLWVSKSARSWHGELSLHDGVSQRGAS